MYFGFPHHVRVGVRGQVDQHVRCPSPPDPSGMSRMSRPGVLVQVVGVSMLKPAFSFLGGCEWLREPAGAATRSALIDRSRSGWRRERGPRGRCRRPALRRAGIVLVEQHDGGGARPGADYRQRRDGDLPPRPRPLAPGRLAGAGPGRRAGRRRDAEPDHGAGPTGWGWCAAPEPGWAGDGCADPDQAEPEPGSAAAPDRGDGSYQDENRAAVPPAGPRTRPRPPPGSRRPRPAPAAARRAAGRPEPAAAWSGRSARPTPAAASGSSAPQASRQLLRDRLLGRGEVQRGLARLRQPRRNRSGLVPARLCRSWLCRSRLRRSRLCRPGGGPRMRRGRKRGRLVSGRRARRPVRQQRQHVGDHPGGRARVRPFRGLTPQQRGDHGAERARHGRLGRVLVDDGGHGGDRPAALLEGAVPLHRREEGRAE